MKGGDLSSVDVGAAWTVTLLCGFLFACLFRNYLNDRKLVERINNGPEYLAGLSFFGTMALGGIGILTRQLWLCWPFGAFLAISCGGLVYLAVIEILSLLRKFRRLNVDVAPKDRGEP